MGYDSRKVDPNRSLCTDPHFGSDDLTGISLYWFRCYICLKFGIGRLGEAHPNLLRLALGSSYRHDSLPLVGRVTLSRTLVSFSAMLQKMLFVLRPSPCIPLRRFLCKCSAPDMSRYREAFARRMAMAGIKPHHRIGARRSHLSSSFVLESTGINFRYQIFEDVCIKQHIGILLIAHHADDQAELLILRLSRNSGVLGLAGMAFVSQLFPASLRYGENPAYDAWVEDPTNQSPLYARNRIRSSLRTTCLPDFFQLELQRLISACRLARSYVESICHKMIKHSVTIMEHGYAVIDLEKLEPSSVDDLCLSRYLAWILQVTFASASGVVLVFQWPQYSSPEYPSEEATVHIFEDYRYQKITASDAYLDPTRLGQSCSATINNFTFGILWESESLMQPFV
ncbi:hypothetical protein GW17_00011177 [Ensete ventricosum]|nr:hypothetical protein GW17_00011177 [Ensete ventricosum]